MTLSGARPAARGATSVVLDARMTCHTGIGRYIRGLAGELLRRPDLLTVSFLSPRSGPVARWLDAAGGSRIPFEAEIYTLKEQLVGSWICRGAARNASVIHFPHYNAPWLLPANSVVTVHDLTHFLFPEFFDRRRVKLARRLLERVVRQAGRLITVSAATRSQLERLLPAARDKTVVIHHGLEPHFKRLSDDSVEHFRQQRGGKRYLLYVGTAKPHKNLDALLEGFAEVRRDHPDVELVLVTPPGGLPAADGVRYVPHVTDDQLVRWYNAAEALLLPSLNEGFGMPALEAMGCGTPVIGSAIDALTEVVGEAGLLVAPPDRDNLAAAMRRLLDDPDLGAELRARSLERAAGFSWADAAQRTLAVYREVARG